MIKNIIKVLLSNAILTIVGLFNSFIFPLLLSFDEYAYYQEYILYFSYVNICHLGIASGMFLNYAGKKYNDTDKAQYKSEINLIYIVLAFFSFICLVISRYSGQKLVLYVALTIFPQCIMASFQALYLAWGKFTGYAIINALPKILFSVIVLLFFIFFKNITGNTVVLIYLTIQWLACIYFLIEVIIFTRGTRTKKIFSKKNMVTTSNGLFITLGNYINLLFNSIDKQFVNILYSTYAFSIYSFAMSMQNIMTIFITAIANPFYPRLAKGDIDKEYINKLKEMLFAFGAYSGCAYFIISFTVRHFITKYLDSLQVVAMFFAVFPAMAVINVLYINLYKIRKKLKKYIITLIGMLIVATLLNCMAIFMHGDYIGIALATMISYYVWLIYSQRDFDELSISRKDCIYLGGFFIVYYSTIRIQNDLVGCVLYFIIITIWNSYMYKNTFKYVLGHIPVLRRIMKGCYYDE